MIRLVRATLEVPGGTTVEREIVEHPGAVSVVAVDDTGAVVLERQYRVALDTHILEIPAGKRDIAGEDPADTARRELLEETGLEATTWVQLAEFYNSPGFTDEHSTVFLATGLTQVGSDVQGPEEEAMEVVRVPIDEIPEMIARGELVDAKSIIGILLALRRLGR
ncbi:MAG: NUDIX hydrolase [Actinobacteria bacterium]|nr:NUDIX hydrolase [Actinomycetota bacterium]